MSGVNKVLHWSQTADQMRSEGMVGVPVFLALAILVEIGAGLAIVIGWKTRPAAFLMVIFLIPVTLIFHDFWRYQGSAQMQQMIHFMKNLAILGGLLGILDHGAGPVSVDQLKRSLAPKDTSATK
jgi:putative oxidoreductase